MLWRLLRDDSAANLQFRDRNQISRISVPKTPAKAKINTREGTTIASHQSELKLPSRTAARASAPEPIRSDELPSFKVYLYSGGTPYYIGEKTTAYVRVPSSGRQEAMTVNQAGEFPRLQTRPGETVQVRLAFTETAPETPIALTAQDGGVIEGAVKATALPLGAARQLAFSFTVSTNPGLHRVTVGTPRREIKIFEFWAGPV
jgi:hypothetical protein